MKIRLKLDEILKLNDAFTNRINADREGQISVAEWLATSKFMPDVAEVLGPLLERTGGKLGEVEVKRRSAVVEPEIVAGSRTFSIYSTTREMDRDREIVMPKGGDLSEWVKTGVITKNHQYSEWPVGKAVWHKADDYGVKMHIQAAPTDDGDQVWALAQFMPLTASIGFVPTEMIFSDHADWTKLLNKMGKDWPEFSDKTRDALCAIHKQWVMLETAIATVPCNPSAVQDELAKALDEGRIDERAAKICKKTLGMPAKTVVAAPAAKGIDIEVVRSVEVVKEAPPPAVDVSVEVVTPESLASTPEVKRSVKNRLDLANGCV